MKKFVAIVALCVMGSLCAVGAGDFDNYQLADLQQRIEERKAQLSGLQQRLSAAAKGSEEAQRLRTQLGQAREFIRTGEAELKARNFKPVAATSNKQLPFIEELKQRAQSDFNLRPAAKQTPLKPRPQAELSQREKLMQEIRSRGAAQ
jgi:uncharacterized membrane protein (DUF106 family)